MPTPHPLPFSSDFPVVPVCVIGDVADAVPLARSLLAGGLPLIEVTLRSRAAIHAITAIATEVPEVSVGAGTVVHPEQATSAVGAGAHFLVSPGSTPGLLAAMADTGIPHLPGVATASEALALAERGYTYLKLFPAGVAGGTAFLRSVAPVLPEVRFCPTGGITAESAPGYLALPNVFAVGGSWVAPQPLVEHRAWDEITSLAQATSGL